MACDSALLPTLVGGAIGFGTALLAEPLRRWLFKPRLTLHFESGEAFKTRTPEEVRVEGVNEPLVVREALYVRALVRNDSTPLARECRAYLVNIERGQPDGTFLPTIYKDSIPLAWACRDGDGFDAIDIPKGVFQFIDLLSTRQGSNIFALHTLVHPLRYGGFGREQGTFRFTVQVSGENADPIFTKILLVWRGIWDDFDVQSGEA